MACKKCGKKNDNDSIFCAFCGERISEEVKVTKPKEKSNTSYRCPHCDAVIGAYDTICPYCGSTLKLSNNRIEEFYNALQSTNDINHKKELIANFYVPNTKEDIKEFFVLAISQINSNDVCKNAWYAKLNQVYLKAKMFSNDREFYEKLNKEYQEVEEKVKKQIEVADKRKSIENNIGIILGTIFIAVGAIFLGVGYPLEIDWMLGLGGFFLLCGLIPFGVRNSKKKKMEAQKK